MSQPYLYLVTIDSDPTALKLGHTWDLDGRLATYYCPLDYEPHGVCWQIKGAKRWEEVLKELLTQWRITHYRNGRPFLSENVSIEVLRHVDAILQRIHDDVPLTALFVRFVSAFARTAANSTCVDFATIEAAVDLPMHPIKPFWMEEEKRQRYYRVAGKLFEVEAQIWNRYRFAEYEPTYPVFWY